MDIYVEGVNIEVLKIKNRKSYYFLKMMLCLFLSLVLIESIFKYLTFKNLFTIELIRIMLFSLTTSALIAFVCTFFKPIVSKIIILFTTLFVGIYTIVH